MVCTAEAAGPAALDFAPGQLSSEAEALRGQRPDMTLSNEQPASGTPAGGVPGSGVPGGLPPPGRSDLSFIPVVWLLFVMALSVYGLVSAWWLVGSSGLPDTVFYFVLGALAFDIITILWGLYLLGLAFGRSAHFPRHFTFWQIAIIVFLLARQAYVLAVPEFVFSARSLAITAAEIGIGLFCIYLLRRDAGPAAVYARPAAQAPSAFASIAAAWNTNMCRWNWKATGSFYSIPMSSIPWRPRNTTPAGRSAPKACGCCRKAATNGLAAASGLSSYCRCCRYAAEFDTVSWLNGSSCCK